MTDIRTLIWNEFVDYKFGDEYLVLYLKRQKELRKWYKITTILLSANGIWATVKGFTIPAIISMACISGVQLLSSVETFFSHSDKSIDLLAKLRMLYYEHANKLEHLFRAYEDYSESELTNRFFELRKESIKIEELDNEVVIKRIESIMQVADKRKFDYIYKNYGQR